MYRYDRRIGRRSHIRHQMMAITAGLVLAVVLTIVCGSRIRQAQASDAYATATCYTSVQITPGDTLWDIADEYMDAGWSDKSAYIDEIRQINHLSGDDIQAGAYILVPYTVSAAGSAR